MLEDDRSDHGDVAQQGDVPVGEAGCFYADVVLPHQGREPEPEECKCKAGGHLVGEQNLGQDAEEQAQKGAADGRPDEPKQRRSGADGHDKTADRAGDHHAFDAEVQNAGPFHDQLADSGQKDRGGRHHEGGQKQDRVD